MKIAPLANAGFAWTRLGFQWLELSLASAQAFAHRAARRNTPAQLLQMGGEKVVAGLEAGNAMARHMRAFPSGNLLSMWTAWLALLTGAMTPYRVRAVRNARAATAPRRARRPR